MPCLGADTGNGRFGNALAPSPTGLTAQAREEYNRRPLTVECWIRIRSKSGFNIIVANEPKSSPTHWEIYTYAGSGVFSAYLPSNNPAEIKTTTDISDDRWHYVAMIMDGKRIRLFVDGREEANAMQTIPSATVGQAGPIGFGTLSEGGIGCDGFVDDLRISNIAREISGIPSEQFKSDHHTIGIWRFDEDAQSQCFKDESELKNFAMPALPVWKRPDRHTGKSLAFMPPEPDFAELRQMLDAALGELNLATIRDSKGIREGLLRDWEEQYLTLLRQITGAEKLPPGAENQAFDPNALICKDDRDPLDVVIRRINALLDLFSMKQGVNAGPDIISDVHIVNNARISFDAKQESRRKGCFLAACALSRQLSLSNPLLDFDDILFVARGVYMGSRKTGPTVTGDAFGQHFATQYFGFNSIPGGGLFIIKNFKNNPAIVNVVKNSEVGNGRLQGRKLEAGAYLSPDLSYDGKTILFSWTQNKEHDWKWSKETAWHIFKVDADGAGLTQLTNSEYDDFDPCWLPGGRIVFISERRGGYIRCFSGLPVPQHVMHSMKADGSDLRPFSFFETGEWHPSVNNDGMVVYTRWDYVDRENCLGSNIWMCFPDGRDPRAPHGNYPYPWHTFPDNDRGDSRVGRPYTEMNIRAVPDSPLYIMTAAPHHGEAFGSICMLDLRKREDGFMSQIRRVTPYVRFPESEIQGRSQYPYGTPWPLSEDFYLCNRWENIYLLDRFGNETLLCENALVFGDTDYDMRLIDPIPLKSRKAPPVIPTQTSEGEDAKAEGGKATISVMNVYNSDLPFPSGTKIKWLRVIQDIPKPNPEMGQPMIGYQNENTPRIPLGIVPVENDGSAYFEAPAGKELIFQVLDENYMAVQSMRSVAYLHRGEHLSCAGCHEDVQKTPVAHSTPLAMRRPPSELAPEAGPIEPMTYYRMVKPVFDKTCAPCHAKGGGGPVDMSYNALEPYAFYFAGGMMGTTIKPIHGGSRTIPGRFGARNSRMGQAMLKKPHTDNVSPEERRRIILWLDANSPRLGAFRDEDAQIRGEIIWPEMDVDPANPQGIAQ
ncbi:MAG TPA: hypothetical protein PL033_04155 [Candidatus Brocadiia bacterium]|nr:hypothetical protein [Candidatus Brocadiia bacterium]